MRLATRVAAAAVLATPFLAASLPGSAARAADDLGTPSGHIRLVAKSADVGVGWTWGNGTLTYGHHTYHFTVKGGSIAAVGYSSVVSTGTVYNLKHLHDFDGTYVAANGEATLGNGVGGTLMHNGNNVTIRIETLSKGARLAGAAQGLELTLTK
ncbi:conserved hypothetical protein [Gluconacetobacter diazotrophicus PA1 5]|uniref:Uncharacterized protein n=2 Tax=Gluconacetobacter diazotrophicus TaxID=33996 RepID=A9HJX9_GLUDA|nr:hypothetical protein [Gluconacetobacter diazotrophicus]ACI50047.1 conserved hypothetical protein [Gluconacetobacter diazotrophicus PA1 5]MBB2156259.1 hypothetical protein [Gluconacetobacter diazotrophicus]TWB07873.1 hypothetical protein FBZ86_10963 [Gluconacetobacter diazotrophicus]CAP55969.1 conserved hypothetical protein [Gluconacetobacter diazotrophicus PA1 5]